MMPVTLAVAERCDTCLRIGGASRGADDEVERFRSAGRAVVEHEAWKIRVMLTQRYGAMIFDCDGVLIDSERVACHIDARELTAIGVSITAGSLASRFSGVSYQDMYRILEQERDVRLPADYAERTHALVLAACEAEGPALAIPGIHALLDMLGPLPKGVASSRHPTG